MTFWSSYETRCKTGRTGAKVCATKSCQNFSQQTQLIWPHWTLNSCFYAFCTIWVHLGPFGWIAKTRCKTGLQVQKFELPSRVGILRNERTQSSELDSKLLFCVFCSIWVHLGLFGCLTRCKTGRTGAKVRATKSRRNFS